MSRKGFIFDLDGVIVDTAKYHFLAWRKLANSIDVDFTEVQNEQLKGVSRVRSLQKILDWGKKSISEAQFAELMRMKNDDYLSYIDSMGQDEILPDVARVLDSLIERNQPISLGSASKNARVILDKVALRDKFDAIVDGNDVSNAKPDPEVFLMAAKSLNIAADQCIVFEDSVAGVEAANIANMISIGIGDANILCDAVYNFRDFTEISTQFIEELIYKK